MIKLFIILIALIVFVTFFTSFGRSGLSYLEKFTPRNTANTATCQENNQCNNTSLNFEPLPAVSTQSYPFIKDGKLILLLLDQSSEKSVQTNIDVLWGGGTIYLGNNKPQSSPDLHKIAYINKDGTLGLISADGKDKINISPFLQVEYISGWSPDSKKLIVFSTHDNTTSIFGGMDPSQNLKRTFDKNRLPGGFYLIDTEKGTITFLYPVTGFVDWIDPERILSSEGNFKEQFIIFNVNDFSADAETFYQKFNNYFGRHFSFSADGKKWAISLGNTGDSPPKPSSSNIILADFPAISGNEIAKGAWAGVQSPIISPKGKRVVYTIHTASQPQWHVGIWDGSNYSKIEDGRAIMWIDENKFIYEKNKEGGGQEIFEYNIETSTKRHLNP